MSHNKLQLKVFSLYRSLLRASRIMPTKNRELWCSKQARLEIEKERDETDPEQIEFLIRVGYGHEDTIITQAKHLTELLDQGILREYDYK